MTSAPRRGRRVLRATLAWAAAAIVASLAPPAAAGPGAARADVPGVFVLGIDGVDPVILRRKMADGTMPNFRRLAQSGGFVELGTAYPPQSPVAWSNFVTGMNPGGHGIFDFLHRDPKTYMPIDSALAPHDDVPGYLELFGWIVPLGSTEMPNNRSGTPFWDVLADAGVHTEIYRMPGNFPPPPTEAFTLTGMGTVDMRGTAGTYTWFTDAIMFDATGKKADYEPVTVEDLDGDGIGDTVFAALKGAPDVFHLPPGTTPGSGDFLQANVVVHVDPQTDTVLIRTGGDIEDGTISMPRGEALVKVGEWTDWLEMDFDALPWGMLTMPGMARFYVKSVRPDFVMYASPVNIVPSDPAQPITTPDDGAERLADELGDFFTQGMPEETNALKDDLFDVDDYVSQVALVHEDGRRMLDLALRRFGGGDMTFMYLSDIDLQCHMLWRFHDPKYPEAPPHPGYDPAAPERWNHLLDGYYEQIDRVLADVVDRLPPEALLLVMSDHGFQPMTRKVHLNAWLRDEGYLVLKDGAATGREAHLDVDWSRTRAYNVGFNGIYLNLQGREAQGIVPPADAEALSREIIGKLEALVDAKNGRHPVLHADRAVDIYTGSRVSEAPDIEVGFDKGYGCSDESTLGGTPEKQIEDNPHGFTGNHLMAPEVVPGILLSNRRIPDGDFDLTDVTVTILDEFGLPPADGMVGQPVFHH